MSNKNVLLPNYYVHRALTT